MMSASYHTFLIYKCEIANDLHMNGNSTLQNYSFNRKKRNVFGGHVFLLPKAATLPINLKLCNYQMSLY